MNFFGFAVAEKETFAADLDVACLWLKKATLIAGSQARLFVRTADATGEDSKKFSEKFCIATLTGEKPNAPLDLKFDTESVEFTVVGNGKVHVIGNRQSFLGDEDEDDDSSEEPQLEPVAKKRKLAATGSSCSSPESATASPGSTTSDDLAARKDAVTKKRSEQVAEAKKLKEKKEAELKKQQAEQEMELKKKKQEEEAALAAKKAAELKKKNAEEAKRLEEQKKVEKQKLEKQSAGDLSQAPIKKTLQGGLKVEIYKRGSGECAKPGRKVTVAYDGRLASNGKRFDNGTIPFKLGMGEVIKGWDLGVRDMQVGEKRKLLIPAHLGYGSRGAPPQIPRNAALIFDVTLKKIQ
eukprot:g16002.t1